MPLEGQNCPGVENQHSRATVLNHLKVQERKNRDPLVVFNPLFTWLLGTSSPPEHWNWEEGILMSPDQFLPRGPSQEAVEQYFYPRTTLPHLLGS